MTKINLTVDGVNYSDEVEPRTLLVHYLRETLGKVGTVVGCDTSNCGACTVDLDGASVKSCTVLAVQADGGEVITVEGLAGDDGTLHPVQQAFHENHGLQCGFCTPGHDHGGARPAQGQPDPVRGRGARGHRGQPVPLHRLPEHRQGGPGRAGRRHSMTAVTDTPSTPAPRSASRASARRTRTSSPGARRGPTTWSCPACCTWRSCAARWRTRRSPRSTPPRRRAAPGVVAVFTGQDFKDMQGDLPCAWPVTPDMVNPGAPSLAVDQVNHVGECVAVVVARTKAAAQDALEGIDVEYEPLPAVLDMEEAIKDGVAARPPEHRVEQVLHVGLRVRRGRHRRSRSSGAGRRRGHRQAAVHPAAAHPGVHGAALDGRAALRRRA